MDARRPVNESCGSVGGRATPVAAFRKASTYLDGTRRENAFSGVKKYCYSTERSHRRYLHAPTSLFLHSRFSIQFSRAISFFAPRRSNILPPTEMLQILSYHSLPFLLFLLNSLIIRKIITLQTSKFNRSIISPQPITDL